MKLLHKQTKLWTTRDGRKIRICDMDDSHLLNTVKLLQRVAEAKRIYTTDFYLSTPGPTADMASYYFEQECDQVFSNTYMSYLPEIYHNLINDAERRGLEIPNVNGLVADNIIATKALERTAK